MYILEAFLSDNMIYLSVLLKLNLKKCEHTTIGIPDKCVKGISGGEKRRLAFACEVINVSIKSSLKHLLNEIFN